MTITNERIYCALIHNIQNEIYHPLCVVTLLTYKACNDTILLYKQCYVTNDEVILYPTDVNKKHYI